MTADDIWKNDALMAINMKLGLPMWKFVDAVQAISAIEREECAKIADQWTTDEQRTLGNGGPAAAILARSAK